MVGGHLDHAETHGVTIRRSLFRSVILLILFILGTFLWITFSFRDQEMRAVSRMLVETTIDHIESRLHRFFDPLEEHLLIARGWGNRGLLDPRDAESANALFMPVLSRYPQISGVSTGDAVGNNYYLTRVGDRWRNRTIRVGSGVGQVDRREHDSRGAYVADWTESPYDVRERRWYKAAAKELSSPSQSGSAGAEGAKTYWTAPYSFASSGRPGISVSVVVSPDAATDDVGESSYVLAMDILLEDITRATMALRPSERGMAFILTEDMSRVLGLPRHERFTGDDTWADLVLSKTNDLAIEPVTAAVESLSDRKLSKLTFVRVTSGGEPWLAGFCPYPLDDRERVVLGVVIPEADFLDALASRFGVIGMVAAAALIMAMVLASLLARDYSTPLKQLLGQSERLSNLNLEKHRPIESSLREVNALACAQERMRTALDSFSRYLPTDLVRELLSRGEAARIGGQTMPVTIMFTDIIDFTATAESMTPTELTEHMAEYFEAMLAILIAEGATVDKFIGDAIVAFWGAPQPDPHHAIHAICAAILCRQRLEVLNADWRQRNLPALPTRFGIATGSAVVGNVGAPSRLSYTALGDTVNLASRLEGLNKEYGTGTLVSGETHRSAEGQAFLWRRLDRVAVKGKTQSVDVYELLGGRGSVPPPVVAFARRYEDALEQYQKRDFDGALAILDELQQAYPNELSVQRLRDYCRQYQMHPPGDSWDGTTRFATK